MKAVYLKNFRKGFATNSSSTHSLIYRNKEDMFKDLNVFELNYYDRYDETIAASKEAKIKYIAANIFRNKKLFEIMCALYPEMKQYEDIASATRNSENYEDFGMYTRGSLYFLRSKDLEASIDYLKHIIDDEEIIIIGGSDEADFVYDTCEGHTKLPNAEEVSYNHRNDKVQGVFKNGNYWVGYGYDGRIRYSVTKDECIPEYPELIDLRITNRCQWNCPFCFMDSNMKEKDADFKQLKDMISRLSNRFHEVYDKSIEFSVGGGNVLLYPHLRELFKLLDDNGHIVNTTINAKDCNQLVTDKVLLQIFKDYVTAIGVSVSSKSDIEHVIQLEDVFKDGNYKQITVHLIPELLGVERTIEIMNELRSRKFYSFLFLGYKTNGRGATQEYVKFTDEELKRLFEDSPYVSLDTTFANTYYEWLKDNYETENTITLNEGEYSMYIDAVNNLAYKSSYQLDKPYNLTMGNYDEHGKTWFTPIEAFANIRRDNGFKVYEKE